MTKSCKFSRMTKFQMTKSCEQPLGKPQIIPYQEADCEVILRQVYQMHQINQVRWVHQMYQVASVSSTHDALGSLGVRAKKCLVTSKQETVWCTS